MNAIMTGKSPILVVMGTGAGKSLLFMLPAYCVSGGTTIVVVPLVSLQGDLKRRCDESGITCRVWDSKRPTETASIVFVTPESAVTKTFGIFINRERAMHRLNRIVVDECHAILASRSNFQPKMQKLRELMMTGIQMVFMTATLRPRDEPRFCQSMNIIGKGVQKFRASTSRPNIRYQIRRYVSTHEKGQDGKKQDSCILAICQVVEELKLKYPAPATIIVYSRFVNQVEALGLALDFSIYHREVDSRNGKEQRVRDWMSGQEDKRVVIATNALGLAIDKPNTRAVVHVGMPKELDAYVQESGRAGRDSMASEAIVMLPEEVEYVNKRTNNGGRRFNSRIAGQSRRERVVTYQPSKAGSVKEEEDADPDVEEFVQGSKCRRIILDGAMDGRFDRMGCEEGEEVCDLCERSRAEEDIFEDSGIVLDNSFESVDISQQDRVEFEQQEQERKWIQFKVQEGRQGEGLEVEELERQLQDWRGQCTLCYVHGIKDDTHSIQECPQDGADDVRAALQLMVDEMTDRDKKRFENYSCCFYCHIPQAICQH